MVLHIQWNKRENTFAMKINNFLLNFLVVSCLFGCSSDELTDCRTLEKDVSASISDGVDTRTSLGDGGKVLWLSGDDISLISKFGYHNRYVVSGAVNSSSTDFSYDKQTPEIDMEIEEELSSHYAIYPYSAGYKFAENLHTINVDLSGWANQQYVAGTFEDDKAIMTAKSSNMNLSFRNAYSLLCIRLNAEISGSYDVSYISVTSKANALNGEATIDMSVDKPELVCKVTSAENKTNQLSFSKPVKLTQTPTNFYLLVPAKTYAVKDLTINVMGKNLMDDEDYNWSTTNNDYDVECFRSKVTTLTKEFKAGTFSGSTDGDIITK